MIMKLKNFTCVFLILLIVSRPIFASRPITPEYDTFTRKGKSPSIDFTCDAYITDDNKSLQIFFNKTIGNISITVSNKHTGEVLYCDRTDAKEGEAYSIDFNYKLSINENYELELTNEDGCYIGVFY